LSKDKKVIFEKTSEALQVFAEEKFGAKKQPCAVVQVNSTSPRLFIVSLGKKPGLLKTVSNQYGFWFQDDCDDRNIKIWTSDGAFQGDKEMLSIYHYDLYVPRVVLDLQGEKLVDATPKCKKYFDKAIKNCKSRLKNADLVGFKNGTIKKKFHSGEVKGRILFIVFSYLYSGRELEAKQELEKMWPPADKQRIWNWMMEKRSNGILRQLN
jgi:hypothetical protein